MSTKIITGISGSNTTTTWASQVPQRITLLETTNIRYPRNIVLTNTGILISRGAYAVGILTADLMAAAVAYENNLTWPPAITTQPTAQSCVHSSTAAVFTVVVSTELSATYQWKYNGTVGTLTYDNVSGPTDGQTITIGSKVYTFKTSLTPTEGEVLINGGGDAALLNLIRAINHSGTPNTDYKCAAANTQVTAATSVTAHAFDVTVITADGTVIAMTSTATHFTWGTVALGWANCTGTVRGCAYTNGTTASLTCTPTTAGQSGVSHECLITNALGTTTSSTAVLTIT